MQEQIDFKYLDKEIVKTYNKCLEILQELKEQQSGDKNE